MNLNVSRLGGTISGVGIDSKEFVMYSSASEDKIIWGSIIVKAVGILVIGFLVVVGYRCLGGACRELGRWLACSRGGCRDCCCCLMHLMSKAQRKGWVVLGVIGVERVCCIRERKSWAGEWN